MDLDASDEQLDCPFLFASARDGYAVREIGDLINNRKDMTPLFETIIDYIPAPEGDPDANTQVLISTIDYNEYVGRIGIGKVDAGASASTRTQSLSIIMSRTSRRRCASASSTSLTV